jgi:hypothetical protein
VLDALGDEEKCTAQELVKDLNSSWRLYEVVRALDEDFVESFRVGQQQVFGIQTALESNQPVIWYRVCHLEKYLPARIGKLCWPIANKRPSPLEFGISLVEQMIFSNTLSYVWLTHFCFWKMPEGAYEFWIDDSSIETPYDQIDGKN